jgi:hypothetical protein
MPSGLECIASSGSVSASRRAESLAQEPAAPRPLLTVVRGEPTEAELAAVLVVLAGRHGPAASPGRKPGTWAARERLLRPAVAAGPGAWRAAGLPR